MSEGYKDFDECLRIATQDIEPPDMLVDRKAYKRKLITERDEA